MLVIDTCVLSEFAKAADRQPVHLRTWLQGADPADFVIPVSAILEIECGIQRLAEANSPKAAALSKWLDGLIASGTRIQGVTAQIARIYARMASTPALKHLWLPAVKKGPQTPSQDLMIAATAISMNAAVLTYNLMDFRLIDQHFQMSAIIPPTELPVLKHRAL